MDKAKEILRLEAMGLSQRDVAKGTGCSLGMVNTVLTRVRESGVTDPLSLDTKELGSIIYPPAKAEGKGKAEIDLEYVDREMKKKGVTLFLLWEEYRVRYPEGYMYTQFCTKYREYRKQNSVYMRKVYKAGERMLVDWAGLTMVYSGIKGEEHSVYVFVAVLPASSYLYAEPFPDMKMESWIAGHLDAFAYFGGVPRIVVPDNTRTAVSRVRKHEAELNRTYGEMAGYYGAAIVPARPRSPKDKAPVETAVQIVERRIIAPLRHTPFLDLEDLREAFHKELENLNDMSFQKRTGSRRSVFLETERNELMKLPEKPYEYAVFKTAKVPFDYHVVLDKTHYYSVPYQFAGKEVLIRATSRVVEVFCEGERIACHIRSFDPCTRFVTDASHMPETHRAVAQWSPGRFISWAAKTGEKTKAYIRGLLERREHPEQAYRTCAAILRLASKTTPSRMEEACERAIARGLYSFGAFQKVLELPEKQDPFVHGNLRGKDYFKEDGNV